MLWHSDAMIDRKIHSNHVIITSLGNYLLHREHAERGVYRFHRHHHRFRLFVHDTRGTAAGAETTTKRRRREICEKDLGVYEINLI